MPGSSKKRARREAEGRELMVIPQPQPQAEPTDRWGRHTKFQPWMINRVRELCADGATDKEVAHHLGIDRSTLYEWRISIPALAQVMKFGKELTDDRMERTAYEIAMGYVMTVEEVVKLKDSKGNELVQTIKREVRMPPDSKMLQWLLKNRRPDVWRDKTEQAHTVEVVHLTAAQARERLKAKIEQLKLGTVQQATG